MTKRFGVRYCDEGGTLTDPDGNLIDHTWDVIDRSAVVDGEPRTVSNHNTRAEARDEAKRLNAQAVR